MELELYDPFFLLCLVKERGNEAVRFRFGIKQILIQMFTEVTEAVQQSGFSNVQADELIRLRGGEHEVAVAWINIHKQFIVQIPNGAF